MFGRHLGRRTFRKLNTINRGFVTPGQMFRMSTQNSMTDNLNADEIRVRLGSKLERKVTEDQLSSAGVSYTEGELPNESNLNSDLNLLKCRYENKFFLSPDYLICFTSKLYSSSKVWFAMMVTIACISYLANLTPKTVLTFGLFCQLLFGLLFWPAEERQFEMWSKLWSNATKISEQKMSESRQLFVWKRSIISATRCLVTLALLYILPISVEPKFVQQLLIASTIIIFLTLFRSFSKLKMVLIMTIILPQILPLLLKGLKVENITSKLPIISKEYLPLINQYFIQYACPVFVGLLSIFSKDSSIFSVLSFSTIFHCSIKSNMQVWILVSALAILISSLKQKCLRFRTFLVVGVIVGTIFYIGEDIKSLQLSNKSSTPVTPLTWQKFNQLCPKNSGISTKLFCSNFVGQKVSWEGRLSDISLEKKTSTNQDLKSIVMSLAPNVIKNLFAAQKFSSNHSSKSRESFCQTLSKEFKLPCDNWSNLDKDYQCRVIIEMSRSLFSGDDQKISGLIQDLDQCLNLKTGSYLQFDATISEIVQQDLIIIQSFKQT